MKGKKARRGTGGIPTRRAARGENRAKDYPAPIAEINRLASEVNRLASQGRFTSNKLVEFLLACSPGSSRDVVISLIQYQAKAAGMETDEWANAFIKGELSPSTPSGTFLTVRRNMPTKGSSRIRRHLEARAAFLRGKIEEQAKVREPFLQKYRSDPYDLMAERMAEDIQRTIDRMQLDLRETEYLLHPPKGRMKDRIYDLALRELESNPDLPLRTLAKKYFPNYFPDRADSAVAMLWQGMNRRRKARKKPIKSK